MNKSHVQWKGKPWCCREYSQELTDVELLAAMKHIALPCQGYPETNEEAVRFLNEHGIDAIVVEGSCPGPDDEDEAQTDSR